MRGSLLRGLADAASIAASVTKIAIEAAGRGAASASAAAVRTPSPQQYTRPWPTQRSPQPRYDPPPVVRQEVEREAEPDGLLLQDDAVDEEEGQPFQVDERIAVSTTATATSTPAPTIPPVSRPEPPPERQQPTLPSQREQEPEQPPREEAKPSTTATEVQRSVPTPPRPDPSLAQASTSTQAQPAPKPQPPPQPQPETQPQDGPAPTPLEDEYDAESIPRAAPLRAAKVPSSRLGRLMHYGSLGAGLAWGAASHFLSGSSAKGGSAFMSEGNLRRLVDKLSKMRGAALKMGQFMSIQDSNMLPPELEEVLLRVQNSANYMPEWQMERVMTEDLGPDWRSHFEEFSPKPFAAASIGQVHSAILSSNHPSPLAGKKVAVKVQFPGIKQSITSDLSYLTTLLTASALLPKGLFLESTIATIRGELEDECNYKREADMGRRFAQLLEDSQSRPSRVQDVMPFAVPRVVDELSTGRVLTTEMMRGRPLTQASRYDQHRRNLIATSILRLCLQELFHFRLMQTDPNWSNFLLNERTQTLELLDFGATREYTPEFIDMWFSLLSAAVAGDKEACLEWSHRIGYLTGEESQAMLDAHLSSMLLLAEPFASASPSPYPFTNQTITARVRSHIPLMLRERKTPPPKETYSLNRKLSGAFLLCAKLGADVRCRELWEEVAESYRQGSRLKTSGPTGSAVATGARGMHTQAGGPRIGRSSSLLSDRRIRQRWDGMPRSNLSSSAWTAKAALDESSRHLDLRSQWSGRSEGLPSTSKEAAELELPPDALGVYSDPPMTSNEDNSSHASASNDDTRSSSTSYTAGKDDDSVPKPVLIRGVLVPRKPPPPGPEDCCMSGCAHCAYDIYADAVQEYVGELGLARERLVAMVPPLDEGEWAQARELGIKPPNPKATSTSSGPSTRTAGSPEEDAADVAEREVDEAVRNIDDPTLKAFLEMERRLKKKEKAQSRGPSASSAKRSFSSDQRAD